MGKYHEESCGLDWVTAEKDVDETIVTMETILASVGKISDFTKSILYEHMDFKEIEEEFIAEIHNNLITAFKDKETYEYMMENKRWQELIKREPYKVNIEMRLINFLIALVEIQGFFYWIISIIK